MTMNEKAIATTEAMKADVRFMVLVARYEEDETSLLDKELTEMVNRMLRF